jgi:hypothetical protein
MLFEEQDVPLNYFAIGLEPIGDRGKAVLAIQIANSSIGG